MDISASITQGSSIRPVTYVVNAADLKTVHWWKRRAYLCTHIIPPAINSHTRETELKNDEQWAQAKNLIFNRAKSLEIIFKNNRRQIHICLPPTLPEITRTTSIKMLGVTVTNHLVSCMNMCVTSSADVRSRYMHLSFFEVMGWMTMS